MAQQHKLDRLSQATASVLMNNPPDVFPVDVDMTLPILEEGLDIQKRTNVTGVVRLDKRVRTFDAAVHENLASDLITVERIPVNRYLSEPVETRRDGDTTIIPVMEEIVIVTKQLVLREEIWITRQRMQSDYHEIVPLRAEEVQVTRTGPDETPGPVGPFSKSA